MHTQVCCLLLVCILFPRSLRAEGDWEVTPTSEVALSRGLEWLAKNQGPQGNWESNDLGLVSMGALAFLADGHLPGRGRYGNVVDRALDYVMTNAKPSGLLNVADPQRDMYNHGLATFVLGQAHGM
ncbi:MAG: squalene--hopene cyclase, partial [Planctomycetaceae bacterium]